VDCDYLIRFLRPYEDYCCARGVALHGVDFDEEWVRHLYEVLTAFDPDMPPELQQALIDIGDLAGEHGHEQIVNVAKEKQLDLFSKIPEVNAGELAFKIYLEHRDVFEVGHARVQTQEARSFVEFFAKNDRPLDGYMTKAKKALLSNRIGQWCASRNRSAFCHVVVTETDDEVSFLMMHGRPPTTHGVIKAETRSRVSYIREKQDLAVFHKNTGKLAIDAQFPVEQDFYRQVFGQVFFGDAEHFDVRAVYTGRPLVEEGSASLSADGIPGLTHVALREIKVVSQTRKRNRAHVGDDNLAKRIDSPWGRAIFEMGEVRYMKMALTLVSQRRPLLVQIIIPNQLKYDRRMGANIVREFLLVRGFMLLPAQRTMKAANDQ
jgi:hypothetical protein